MLVLRFIIKTGLAAVLFCLLLSGNTSEGTCPRGGGTTGSAGTPSASNVGLRFSFSPGLMPYLQTVGSGVDSWEVWWTNNRENYLKFRNNPIEWVKRVNTGGTTVSVTKYPIYDKLINLLIKNLMEEDDSSLVSSAAFALAKSGDERAPELLIKAYQKHTQYLIRNNILLALGLTGSLSGVEILKEALLDKKNTEVTRGFAALALGYIKDVSVMKFLEDFIVQKNDIEVIGSTAFALGNLKDTEAISIFVKLLNPSDAALKLERRARVWTVLGLGRIGNKAALEELKKLIDDKEVDIRSSVAISLGLINSADSKKALFELTQDKSMIVRGFAAISLVQLALANPDLFSPKPGTSPNAAAAESLCMELIALYNKSKGGPEPSGMIILALGLLGDERAKPFLRETLSERKTRSTIKAVTALALGMMKDTASVNELLMLAQKQQDDLAIIPHVILALGMIGDPKAVNVLTAIWDKAQKDVSRVAYTNIAVALMMIGKNQDMVLPRLKKDSSKEANAALRPFALHTLGLVGGRDDAQVFIDLCENESDVSIRNAIIYAVGFLMDKEPVPLIKRIMANNNYNLSTYVMEHLLPIPQW
ncbi:MAG: HEAT repeat domain-containing protein [Planctomycetota bacterium]